MHRKPMQAQEARLLLVEDDVELCRLLTRHFRAAGMIVEACSDAESAWLAVLSAAAPYDAVVSDVHLPGESGVSLAHRLQARSPSQSVVLITGDHDGGIAAEALGTCVSSYLLKPFELFELDAAVAQAISRGEFLEALAAAQLDGDSSPTRDGSLPRLLQAAEERSGAGAGHGYRTALFARQIAQRLIGPLEEGELDDLEVAARSHEIGRLINPTGSVARQSEAAAGFLRKAGGTAIVVELLELKEADAELLARSSVIPRRLATALRLGDELDHALARGAAEGLPLPAAVRAAVRDMRPAVEAESGTIVGLTEWLLLVLMLADGNEKTQQVA